MNNKPNGAMRSEKIHINNWKQIKNTIMRKGFPSEPDILDLLLKSIVITNLEYGKRTVFKNMKI